MWRAPFPTSTVSEVLQACLNQTAIPALRERVAAATLEIEAATRTFEAAGRAVSFYLLKSEDFQVAGVTKEEMESMYDRMSRAGTPARSFYDQIRNSRKLCPMCNQRIVETVDHYLPKKKFPALAVSPPNLLPACSDCNKIKLASVPSDIQQQTLNPYYDDVESAPWLKATIRQSVPAVVRFYVDPPPSWSEDLAERAKFHFRTFRLGRLYSIYAGEEASLIRAGLKRDYKRGGSVAVRQTLAEAAQTRLDARINSWQTAAYFAWRDDDWFCNSGFDLIG
ncbi:HNH endonuclease [Actinoplanes rectilineatus]|uniref:HNH endonuclease n=1 Tax=Actinoplanes rectilineatus TaxID=113571 RepID=UPI000A7D0849|nr:HNH endonuclease signature motif containing protein [Actinoplanes rectilineatus]